MEDVRIILSALWIATMLTYLLGDVLRIMSGDSTVMGREITQGMWLPFAALMMIPIVMVVLSLTLTYPVTRWTNIIVAVFWFIINLIGVPTYPSAYDKFLLIVSMGFNVITIWYTWNWV
jgi:hypothetical protein